MKINSLCREERLRGEKAISHLFNSGNTFFQSPYKVFWIKVDESAGSFPVRFAVSVSKRRFKHAVKRNLLKRRTREVFRTNKQIFHDTVIDGGQIHMIVIYSSDILLPLTDLDSAMKKTLHRIANQYVESV